MPSEKKDKETKRQAPARPAEKRGEFGGETPGGGRVPGVQSGLDGAQNRKGSAIDNEDEVEDAPVPEIGEDQVENIDGGRKQGNWHEQHRP
jgi:hypothetical protein